MAIRHFIRYYKPHLPLFMLDFTSAFIVAILDLVFPKVTSFVIDDVIPAKNLDLMFKNRVSIACCLYHKIYPGIHRSYYGHILGTKIEI